MAQQPQLVLAVHTVEAATAKVPFAMILLLDFAKRKATPPGCRCRMVIPSDGTTSISLWDAMDISALQEWMAENLGGDCTTQLSEVQEDFTFGLSLELTRMRAAERVADGSKKTIGVLGERTGKAAESVAAAVTGAVGTTKHQLDEWDQRTGVLTSAKETTAAIQQKVIGAMSKAAENERVHAVVSNVSTGVTTGWAKVSNWVGQQIRELHVDEGAEDYGHASQQYGSQQPQHNQYEGRHNIGEQAAGGDLRYSDSADRPLTFSDSMNDEPAASHPAAVTAGPATTAAPAQHPAAY